RFSSSAVPSGRIWADNFLTTQNFICYASRLRSPPVAGNPPGGIGRFIRLKLPITSLLHSFIPSFT
ncbi:hypothetical protein, partial [Nocardia cyriacigeorgica]|uniref:hypothetical protein n=1 Tax=Nocardia cyriacigeorgica TaxID=135487 RepID=UPI0024587389